jgi:hypothetical protein
MPSKTANSSLQMVYAPDGVCRILTLDGGGAKGFYTLGVLKEIEAKLGCPLHKRFDLIFGTSTGSIIASLLCLGYKVDDIHALYQAHVPTVMRSKGPKEKKCCASSSGNANFWRKDVCRRVDWDRSRCDALGDRAPHDFQGQRSTSAWS